LRGGDEGEGEKRNQSPLLTSPLKVEEFLRKPEAEYREIF
jgi:hypothetical protein